jgi:hypothetical protein
VVAISGAYECGEAVPGGIIADGFYAKGQHHPETLLTTVADLIRTSAARASAHQQQSAPLSVAEEALPEVQETPCLFCPNTVRYLVDFSLSVSSPGKKRPEGTATPRIV